MPQPIKDVGEDMNALQGIMSDHKSEIVTNTKLAAEFEKLKECLSCRATYTLSDRLQAYTNIMREVEMLSSEHQRICEESPLILHPEQKEERFLEDNSTLRDALERFRKSYLN